MASWPPSELLSDLQRWVEKVETRLGQEKVKALQASDASQLADTLQQLQVAPGASASHTLCVSLLQSHHEPLIPAGAGCLHRSVFVNVFFFYEIRYDLGAMV